MPSTQAAPSTMRYYHGYSLTDKENDSRELYVYSEELLPFLQGKIEATEVETRVNTAGVNGSNSDNVVLSNGIRCIYRESDSNRAFPPSVRKGEQVLIYNNGDTDTWYWKSEGRNDELRRTDTLRYGCSGTLDTIAVPNDDNTYFFEIDTRNKHHIKLSTSSADGEKFRYTMLFDADAGKVVIGDSAENVISIESATPRVCMKNKDKSLIDLNGKNIVISCEQDITIKAETGKLAMYSKDKMIQTTESTLDVTATDNITVLTDAKYHCRSASTMSLVSNSDTMIQSSSDMEVNVGGDMNTQTGGSYDLGISGNFTMSFGGSGNMDGGGGVLTMSIGRLNING